MVSLGACLYFAAISSPLQAQGVVDAQTEIVVSGHRNVNGTKFSDWKQVESEHIILFGTSSERDLKRIVIDLEYLHKLLTKIYVKSFEDVDRPKIVISLLDSRSDFKSLNLQQLRWQQGPYAKNFEEFTYYNPGVAGDLLIVARSDQTFILDTIRRYNLDCDDYQSSGGTDNCGTAWKPPFPAVRSWKAGLYSIFVRRFVATYLPDIYPRWYLEALGALFSTTEVRADGSIEYAIKPKDIDGYFRSYGYPNVEAIITGKYVNIDDKAGWSPYNAWILGHYFLFSDLPQNRSAQIHEYLEAWRSGSGLPAAATAFHGMRALQYEVVRHAESSMRYAHAPAPRSKPDEPVVTTLTVAQAALIPIRLRIDSQLGLLDPEAGAAASNLEWLAEFRRQVTASPEMIVGVRLLAEADCRVRDYARCLLDAEQILTRRPDDPNALTWKGVALIGLAIDGSPDQRQRSLAVGRQVIRQAIAADSSASIPRIAYFLSYSAVGDAVPDDALQEMARAISLVPAAPGPRLHLARELVRQGQVALAHRILNPIVNGAFDSPERTAAIGSGIYGGD